MRITVPDYCGPEAEYAIRSVFETFLGIPFTIESNGDERIRIEHNGKSICTPSQAFREDVRTLPSRLRNLNTREFDVSQFPWLENLDRTKIPILFGETDIRVSESSIHFEFDIFATVYIMLSRIEESSDTDLDKHRRYDVTASLSWRNEFLTLPIVDIYTEIVWSAITALWPSAKRKPQQFQVVPTHDIDDPYLAFSMTSPTNIAKRGLSDIFRRKSVSLARKTIAAALTLRSRSEPSSLDPYNTHSWLMSQSEMRNLRSQFFFMAKDSLAPPYGGRYDPNHSWITQLFQEIRQRGHSIGIHPTDDSSRSSDSLQSQIALLTSALSKAKVHQHIQSSRQHYLLWNALRTPNILAESGITVDSTLGFASHIGFRCGTCHSFPLWDLENRRPSGVWENPLLVMDGTLTSTEAMNLTHEQAHEEVASLKRIVRHYRGNFVVLWHNTSLLTQADRELYVYCIS